MFLRIHKCGGAEMNSSPKAYSVISEGDVSDYTRFSTESKVFSSAASHDLIRRIQNLKTLQERTNALKLKLNRDVAELILTFGERLSEIGDIRKSIISGEKDREGDESIQNDEIVVGIAREIVERNIERDKSGKLRIPLNGIPNFWLTVFKNSWSLRETVQSHDEPILSRLDDLRVVYTAKPQGFRLEFHFGKNEYFENPVLTKQYVVEGNPTSLKSAFEIISSSGCRISWFRNKDVTVRLGKKRQKHKISGRVRYVTAPVTNASFFSFFSPPAPGSKQAMTRDERKRLAMDYELGQYFRTKIVPDAYVYFAGQMDAKDDEDFEDDSSDSSDLDSLDSKCR